jgi:hypothetical protein
MDMSHWCLATSFLQYSRHAKKCKVRGLEAGKKPVYSWVERNFKAILDSEFFKKGVGERQHWKVTFEQFLKGSPWKRRRSFGGWGGGLSGTRWQVLPRPRKQHWGRGCIMPMKMAFSCRKLEGEGLWRLWLRVLIWLERQLGIATGFWKEK